MIKNTTCLFLIAIITVTTYSQESVRKAEIYSKWIKNSDYYENPDIYKVGFDSVISVFIDSLKLSEIDTIGVYEKGFEISEVIDTCICRITPWEVNIDWIDEGITYHQKFTEYCDYYPIQIEYSVFIKYYINAKSKIMQEILEIVKNRKNRSLLTNDDPEYCFYCTLGEHSRFTRFEYSDLENKNGIIDSWRKMIENQLKEIRE